MTQWNLKSTLPLLGGGAIPRFGLGVWQCPMEIALRSVLTALELGYRQIDTARIYGNEADVGTALLQSGIPRQEVFVTTKLWTEDHGYDEALRAFDGSLGRLKLDYVDLYLSHFPVAEKRLPAWKALATLPARGQCRAIGVSNYTVAHLQQLIDATGVVPAVNQVELHPYLYQKDLIAFCKKHKIVVTAYSPLTHGKRLSDPKLKAIAENYDKTTAQLLLRWGLQKDLVVIPKSTRRERLEENAAIFDFQITEGDMRTMDRFDEGLRTCWDPTDEP